jgi:hypothetical protein
MVLSLSYRRPVHVSSSRTSLDSEKPTESISSGSSGTYGIPDALSFDKIISGGTCPVSLDDTDSLAAKTDILIACDYPRIHGFPALHRT